MLKTESGFKRGMRKGSVHTRIILTDEEGSVHTRITLTDEKGNDHTRIILSDEEGNVTLE